MKPMPALLPPSVSAAVLLLFLWLMGVSSQDCTKAIYGSSGSVDFTKTLHNCSNSMSDPEIIYSYKDTAAGPVTVYTQINLNNLVTVSELESTMVLDLFFVLSWVDPRWSIPDMWTDQKTSLAYQGLAIDQLVFSTDELRLRVWLPDITFTDEIAQVMVSQTLKIRPGGQFLWTRHLRLDIVQPHFTYEDFPMDIQKLNIRFMSNAYSTDFLRLKYSEKAIHFVNSAYPNQDDANWELNNQWFLNVNDHTTLIWVDNRTYTYGSETITMSYDSAILILDAERISDGMLIRLGFPILILMVLSGLVFWAATEHRIDATMTILLAVSALYIVVFGSIPMLGYLTAFDTYIISMFFILTCCVAIHQLNYRISEKADRRPLRYVVVRSFEFLGRITIFPTAIIMFLVMFPSQFITKLRTPLLVVLSIVILIVALRDFGGVRKTFFIAMAYFEERRDKGEMHSMSEFELKVFLFYEKYIKEYCFAPGMDDAEDDQQDDNDDTEYVPRMPNPNSSTPSKTSIYVVNTSRSSVTPSMLANGHESSPLNEDGRDFGVGEGSFALSNGVQLKDLSLPDAQNSTPNDKSGHVKRPSKKRMKKQAIIDGIISADKERTAKKRESQNLVVGEEFLDPSFVNPMISSKK
jgi:hypothetical protein